MLYVPLLCTCPIKYINFFTYLSTFRLYSPSPASQVFNSATLNWESSIPFTIHMPSRVSFISSCSARVGLCLFRFRNCCPTLSVALTFMRHNFYLKCMSTSLSHSVKPLKLDSSRQMPRMCSIQTLTHINTEALCLSMKHQCLYIK